MQKLTSGHKSNMTLPISDEQEARLSISMMLLCPEATVSVERGGFNRRMWKKNNVFTLYLDRHDCALYDNTNVRARINPMNNLTPEDALKAVTEMLKDE